MKNSTTAFFWFRRDLRLEDNHGLFEALKAYDEVIPVFIFDDFILDKLSDKSDRRVDFIQRQLTILNEQISALGGGGLLVLKGQVKACWQELLSSYEADAIFCNSDYEPYALDRDFEIDSLANDFGVAFLTFKDQVIFEDAEILKKDGDPYTVFTPYSKVWKARLTPDMLKPFASLAHAGNFSQQTFRPLPTLEELGFEETDLVVPSKSLKVANIENYGANRDIPSRDATSHMSVHLRFGTVSIRSLVEQSLRLNETFVNELIWREFFKMILCHFPHSVEEEFRAKYRRIEWRNDAEGFALWCAGKTGFPIVDAGMRELNATGFMHNRVRMITASFLVKDLLVDWRLGEAYFAEKLLDYEQSANIGNWQWAAGTGCDAAPYFRIFNPTSQQEKFDPDFEYIKHWVPEFGTSLYPQPIVDHKKARLRALEVYKSGIARGVEVG